MRRAQAHSCGCKPQRKLITASEAQECRGGRVRRKFLGYNWWGVSGGVVKRKVAVKPLQAFKHRIRELTRRSGGRSMKEVVERLRPDVLGWKAYFGMARTPKIWRALDEWMRHRAAG